MGKIRMKSYPTPKTHRVGDGAFGKKTKHCRCGAQYIGSGKKCAGCRIRGF